MYREKVKGFYLTENTIYIKIYKCVTIILTSSIEKIRKYSK